MTMPHTVDFVGRAPSQELETIVRTHAERLQRTCPDATGLRVRVLQSRAEPGEDSPVGVWLDLALPQQDLAVLRQHRQDVRAAVSDAFDAVARKARDILHPALATGRAAR